jgi:hypothetical protein
MDPEAVRAKFGDDFFASARTYRMGIDRRLARHIALRFRYPTVLETCTGGGFSTIALAEAAGHVLTIEIDPVHHAQAKKNVEKAGIGGKVTFILGDALDHSVLEGHPPIDAAFLDPDWADREPGHVYRFRGSNTEPPADLLLDRTRVLTPNIGLVLPPAIDPREYEDLPPHERQEVYLEGSHELTCLYFGELAYEWGVTECRVG